MAILNSLIINAGSSSLKVSCFDSKLHKLHEAQLSNMLSEQPQLNLDGVKSCLSGSFTVSNGLKYIFEKIEAFTPSVIAHRIVHGGPHYFRKTEINDNVINELKDLYRLAPLHNPACVEGIESAKSAFPALPQFAIFDTAFHHTLTPTAYTYGIPYDLTKKYNIRRYGFHGIAHAYLWKTYNRITQNSNGSIITLHLGNGCSAAAIKAGRSLDTSMGFTPLEGLLMSSRCGDIDPSIIQYLTHETNQSIDEVTNLLYKKSGLLGVSEESSDMKALLESKSPQAQLAIDIFCYRILKYIGAYQNILQGCDAILFSGGIGENAASIREKIIAGLEWQGVALDKRANEKAKGLSTGAVELISSSTSKLAVYVIGVDENYAIAEEIHS